MGDNTYTKGYADGAALTESELDTAYKSLKLDISNTTTLTSGSTSGQFLQSNGSGIAASFGSVPDPLGPFALRNYGLSTSTSAGALTISLKTKALSDPSTNDAVDVTYSTNGTTSATYSAVQVTSALSLTITASATLGFQGTATNRVFVYAYYNTATTSVKLAVSARADLDSGNKSTTVAMAASADSQSALYATAVLSVAPRLLGYVESALNASSQWQSATKVNVSNNQASAAWKSWVPTYSPNASATVSSSSLKFARYRLMDGTCFFSATFVLKFATATPTNVTVSLPVSTSANYNFGASIGTGTWNGGSPSSLHIYQGTTPGTDMLLAKSDFSAFATGSSIQFYIHGFYEI